jgi:hypothetical protein
MAEVLAQFDEPLLKSSGIVYRARACGASMPDGLWEGWIEFIPVDGGKPVRSPRETTQPNRADTAYWATGLTAVYLEGALERALRGPVKRTPLPHPPPAFDRPAANVVTPDAMPVGHAILDPFGVYERGEAALRQKLQALSASHLRNIILDYELSDEPVASLDRLAYDTLIDLIVVGVRARISARGPA